MLQWPRQWNVFGGVPVWNSWFAHEVLGGVGHVAPVGAAGTYVGWDCGDGLADTVARVKSAGYAVTHDDRVAAVRKVDALAAFTDPWGFRHELTHGLADVGAFTPGRPISGFVTGEQGLGHAVFLLPDLDDGLRFYIDVLGFRLSDHIEMGISLRFLHCNPRHHTVALSAVPGMVGMHHLMLEVNDVDDVGRTLDLVTARAVPVAMGLGRHTNDFMTSFYALPAASRSSTEPVAASSMTTAGRSRPTTR